MLTLIFLAGCVLQSDSSRVPSSVLGARINALEVTLAHARDSLSVADACVALYKEYKFEQLLDFPGEYAYLVRSLRIYEKTQAYAKAGYVCNALGGFHFNHGQTDKAEHFWQYSLELYQRAGAVREQGAAYNNLSLVTSGPMKLEYLQKAVQIQQDLKDSLALTTTMHNLGSWYFDHGDLAKAEQYYLEATQLAASLQQSSTQQAGYLFLGKVRQRQGKYEDAIRYIEKSISFNSMREEDDPNSLSAYQLLAELHASLHDYKKAYHFQQIIQQKRDTLYHERHMRTVADMETRYETGKKEEQIAVGKQQRFYMAFFLAVAVLGLMLIALLYLQARKNKRRIEEQNQSLVRLNRTKDRFFGIIAHDLRNPLVALSGLFKLVYLYANTGDLQKLKSLEERTYKSISEVTHLLDNLLNWASSQKGALPYHPEPLDVKRLFDEQCALFRQSAMAKGITLSICLDGDYCALGDRNGISTVLRNLISNAIKFTGEGGAVKLSAHAPDSQVVTLTVADSGLGMSPQASDMLFAGQTSIVAGTHGEKGTGLGILICQEFIALNKGTLKVISEANCGTTFYVSLPKL